MYTQFKELWTLIYLYLLYIMSYLRIYFYMLFIIVVIVSICDISSILWHMAESSSL